MPLVLLTAARVRMQMTTTINTKYPGVATVIHGNGAVAHVMAHVCGGVIGYPITPSTEISELYEAFRASGGCNVWGKHPFFFEPEGEHSAQSGALGAALTGGKYVSNASSSQGILYGIESHYVTVGKKAGGFVLHVAARAVSRHSLNVMAGHDDVYALLPSGYTILFASNPQEAADLAAIAYKVSALSLLPVANAMDGFATSHMLCEALMPEPELLAEFLGDPEGRIAGPHRRARDAVRRQRTGLPTQSVSRAAPGRHRAGRLRAADDLSRRPRRRDRARQRRATRRRDGRVAARGTARTVAAPVGQRPRKGHPAARPGAGRRSQSGLDRRGAESSRLPGGLGRSSHALRERSTALRSRSDGRVRPAHRTRVRSGRDVSHATMPTTCCSGSVRSPTTPKRWPPTCGRKARRSASCRSSCAAVPRGRSRRGVGRQNARSPCSNAPMRPP